jgi:surface protein
MFACCYSLDKNIGKKWNTKKVESLCSMFSGCSKINKPIGQNWDVSNVTNFSVMFLECKKLQFSAGKNWKVSPNISVLYCAKPDFIWLAEEGDF